MAATTANIQRFTRAANQRRTQLQHARDRVTALEERVRRDNDYRFVLDDSPAGAWSRFLLIGFTPIMAVLATVFWAVFLLPELAAGYSSPVIEAKTVIVTMGIVCLAWIVIAGVHVHRQKRAALAAAAVSAAELERADLDVDCCCWRC